MKEFTNFNDLIKFINGGIKKGLETNVQDVIKNKISETARREVILKTSGRDADGIDDVKCMKGFVKISKNGNVFDLIVKDMARPAPSVFKQPFDESKNEAAGGTVFAQWIEKGEWIDLAELLRYRHWAGWMPGEGESWTDAWKNLGGSTGHGDGMTRKEWSKKPRREPRPFISVVQREIINNSTAIEEAILKSIQEYKA